MLETWDRKSNQHKEIMLCYEVLAEVQMAHPRLAFYPWLTLPNQNILELKTCSHLRFQDAAKYMSRKTMPKQTILVHCQ